MHVLCVCVYVARGRGRGGPVERLSVEWWSGATVKLEQRNQVDIPMTGAVEDRAVNAIMRRVGRLVAIFSHLRVKPIFSVRIGNVGL